MYPLRSVTVLRSKQRAVQLTQLQARYFHPTKPTQSVIETVLDGSTAVIQGIHTASCLPWVAAIPLTALLVRASIGFPLQFYSRLRAQEEKRLQPLLSSWGAVATENAHRKATGEPERKKQIADMLTRETKRIHKAWGISTAYRPLMILQIPVFITVMESLRSMSGNNQGIFAWLKTVGQSEENISAAAATATSRLEPSFMSEGALWFPDLLAGDQTGILPVLLTFSILGNVASGWKTKPFKELSELPKLLMYKEVTFRGLRLFVQALSCQVGLMAFANQLPVALLLYWITSTNIATLQTLILDKIVFAPKMARKPFLRKYVAFEKPGTDDPFQLKNLR